MAVLFPKKVPAFSRALGESDDGFDFDNDYIVPAEVSASNSIEINENIGTLIIGVGSAQCNALKETLDFSRAQIIAESDLKPVTPFVRVLRTPKAASEHLDIKVLEPPNIISGFAAALMSHCIYESLSACVLITYYDNVRASSTDQDIAAVIAPILRSTSQLQPYILLHHKPPKLSVQNFDQMYI
nr:Proteasome assembly chaperone 1 [Hymenolepis microstoma]